jgi:hypothetical protein
VKLATVFGTSSSNNRAVNVPSLVVKCACVIGIGYSLGLREITRVRVGSEAVLAGEGAVT